MIAGRKISLEEIYEVVQQIVDKFHPQSIILFGSYAYGQPEPWSDVDLLVIMDTPLKEIDQAVEICRSIRCDFPIDLIVYKAATRVRSFVRQRLGLSEDPSSGGG
jgi:predicted nucleotidyltransferase